MSTLSIYQRRRKEKGARLAALGCVQEDGFRWTVHSLSGYTYRVTVDRADEQETTYTCSCPDTENPCKHVRAVMVYRRAQTRVSDAFHSGDLRSLLVEARRNWSDEALEEWKRHAWAALYMVGQQLTTERIAVAA